MFLGDLLQITQELPPRRGVFPFTYEHIMRHVAQFAFRQPVVKRGARKTENSKIHDHKRPKYQMGICPLARFRLCRRQFCGPSYRRAGPEPIPPPPVQQAVPTQLTLKKAVALPTAVRADVRFITVAAPLRKDRLGR
jgi:hypothetical protein